MTRDAWEGRGYLSPGPPTHGPVALLLIATASFHGISNGQ